MTSTAITISVLGLLAFGPVARAEGSQRDAEHQTLEDFGAKTATCREWTDLCATCLRRDGEDFGCSLPGIACQPAAIRCVDPPAPDLPAPARQ